MEFAAVNSPKSAAKTVAITLTNEEAKNPANAFSALLNLGAGGMKFNAEQSLSKAEGQWLRAAQSAQRERDATQKPKTDHDINPKDKVADAEKPADEEHDDVTAADGTSQKTEETSANDNSTKAATEAQPTEQVAAVGLDAIQSVAIQFQILVQMPDGNLQDMGTFDLKALIAAASQNSQLASALEAAFGQAAESLAAGQSLLGDLTQAATVDPNAMTALQDLGAVAAVDAGDNTNVAELFKQIAAAFRPLAHQAVQNAAATQATKTATNATAAMAEHVAASNDLVSPEVAEQSAALSKILGEDSKIRIQVAVNGRTVADMPFAYSQFNRYTGYNPEASRTASTANGQVGMGTASNTTALATETAELLTPQTTTAPTTSASTAPAAGPAAVVTPMAANTGFQTNVGSQQNGSTGGMPREAAPVRGPEAGAATPAANSSSNPSQPTSFAAALNQASGNTATTQTAAAERPVPTQPQQVVEQIKVNITRAAKAGLDRVTIQLRPEELGRIEIKLEMTSEGKVSAAVTADKPATLELLQREARGLERALQDAGLRADANDLEFNLRSEDQARLADKGGERNPHGREQSNSQFSESEIEADDMYDYALAASQRGGVDTYV